MSTILKILIYLFDFRIIYLYLLTYYYIFYYLLSIDKRKSNIIDKIFYKKYIKETIYYYIEI